MPSAYTYSTLSVGSGVVNLNASQGAQYGQQAMAMPSTVSTGSQFMTIHEIERRSWAID